MVPDGSIRQEKETKRKNTNSKKKPNYPYSQMTSDIPKHYLKNSGNNEI